METEKTDLTVQSVQANLDTAISLIPHVQEPTSHDLSRQYEIEKLGFEWRTHTHEEGILTNKEYFVKDYFKPETAEQPFGSKKMFDTKG